jgi:hypothetical protein
MCVAATLAALPSTMLSQGTVPVVQREYAAAVTGTYAQDLAVSPKGGWLFFVGTTTDPNYPVTPDAYDGACGSDARCNPTPGRFGTVNLADIVFTVLDSAGQVRYSTFLGGAGQDDSPAIAVSRDGTAWISGRGTSPDFPSTGCAGSTWIAQFDADLKTLRSLRCVGLGTPADIALDPDGALWLLTTTSVADLPTPNGWQARSAGFLDLYLAQFAPGESTPRMATYIGGSSLESSAGLCVTPSGSIAVAGNTTSQDFPVVRAVRPTSAVQPARADAVVAVLDRAGRLAHFSTYWGGEGSEMARSIACDRDGSVLLAGDTQSADMPVTTGAVDRRCGVDGACDGSVDAFVARFSAAGALLASTYYGGRGVDTGLQVGVRADGRPILVGSTQSPDFPLIDAAPTRRGMPSVVFAHTFLAQFDAGLERVTRASFVADDQFTPNIGTMVESRGFALVAGQVFPQTGLTGGTIGTYVRSLSLVP